MILTRWEERLKPTAWHVAAGSRHTLCGAEIPSRLVGTIKAKGPLSSVDCDDCLQAWREKHVQERQEALL